MASGRKKATFARILEVLSSGRAALRGQDETVTLRVHVDPTCPRALALATKRALVAERAGGVVDVMGLAPAEDGAHPDAALVLVGAAEVSALVSLYARSGVPVAMVAEGALDVPGVELPEQAAALVGVVAASSAASLEDKLAAWLVSATDKHLALAANFAFCRDAVCDALVSRCALENAAVGAISIIPGSDLPIMCANQAKLALDLAAAHGRGLEPARLLDLLGVLGAALAYRTLARTASGVVPGVGALVKAGVGYGGTVATATAVRAHLAHDEDAPAGRAEKAGEPVGGPAPSQALPVAADDGYVTIAKRS